MNFNISGKKDYVLQARHTHELINLYGVRTKLVLTEKINYDSSVFGDFQSIKANKNDIFDVNMMPETSESFDDIGTNFSDFGMMNIETIRLFVSRKSIEAVFTDLATTENVNGVVKRLQSNLIILPNNRVMEITDVEFMVPGINNLFTQKDIKNVYKLTLKTYDKKLTDDIDIFEETEDLVGSYKELDSYFNELTNNHEVIEEEAIVELDRKTAKPVVIKPDDNVFGRF